MSTATAIGVDVGSTTFKAVICDGTGRILDHLIEPTRPQMEQQAREGIALLVERLGCDPALPISATGYGRKRIPSARQLTEITCHALGAFHLTGRPGLLVDMGGQDTKVVRFGSRGEVLDFAMNDKCAAGTGRFLEVILHRLCVPLTSVAELASKAERPVTVSSTCTVFAESEVVSLVAQGEPVEGIVFGLHRALASRVAALVAPLAVKEPLLMSGGVALNQAMVRALEHALGNRIAVLPRPQLVGALGAALAVRNSQ
ncbi:MAG: hypothetical protein JW797_10205 [Bradymonadales bacterium]|nr:hypothetical protein [Bradymonadales bacterium]